MMHIHAYKQHTASRWTRIEMLLELYNSAISALQQASEALDCGDDVRATRELTTAQRLVAGIVAGLNRDVGELPRNIERLCLFVVEQIGRRDPRAALRVLTPLRDGFAGIRERAVALERTGEIPEMDYQPCIRIEA
jgi:flagellin-specific chaperone FliS